MTNVTLKNTTISVQTAENGYIVSSQGKRTIFTGVNAGIDAQTYAANLLVVEAVSTANT